VTATELPWSVLEDYQCFGCSPRNPSGLGLTFSDHPEGLTTSFALGRGFESYPGVVHGGLLGVVCDETMGNLIVARTGLVAFTVSLRLRYLSPVLVGATYSCVARLGPVGGDQLTTATADVFGPEHAAVVTATATYRTVLLAAARDRIALTAPDATRLDHALSAAAGGGADLSAPRAAGRDGTTAKETQ